MLHAYFPSNHVTELVGCSIASFSKLTLFGSEEVPANVATEQDFLHILEVSMVEAVNLISFRAAENVVFIEKRSAR